MDGSTVRRVLVAVDPLVLEGALATLLAEPSIEVVQYHGADPAELRRRCDAAIVTIELPDELRPDVVITLPDTNGPEGAGWVSHGAESRPVAITTYEDVRGLLEEHLPR